MTRPRKISMAQAGIEPRSAAFEAAAITNRPKRRLPLPTGQRDGHHHQQAKETATITNRSKRRPPSPTGQRDGHHHQQVKETATITNRPKRRPPSPTGQRDGHSCLFLLLAKWLRRPPRERKIPGSNPACDGFFPPGSSHTSEL